MGIRPQPTQGINIASHQVGNPDKPTTISCDTTNYENAPERIHTSPSARIDSGPPCARDMESGTAGKKPVLKGRLSSIKQAKHRNTPKFSFEESREDKAGEKAICLKLPGKGTLAVQEMTTSHPRTEGGEPWQVRSQRVEWRSTRRRDAARTNGRRETRK
jgi:hypothetical protein